MLPLFGNLKKIIEKNCFSELVAGIGFLVYFVFSLLFAHTIQPNLDEGLYTYKGWLFVSGRSFPYQDYGPWMNHMPLSFLIPGAIQYIFGPGLRTGRYFAIFLSLLMLFGLYLTSRRLGGKWIAVAVIWAFALNLSTIAIYSTAISQGLVACIMVWVLFLSLGNDRLLWQVLLATFLAAALVLVRLNMAPFFFALVAYLYWENGRERKRWIVIVAGISLVGLHIFFLPGILNNWLKWIRPIVDAILSLQSNGLMFSNEPSHYTKIPYSHINSVFITVKSYFIAVVGTIGTWLLWPPRSKWENLSKYRAAVFLSVAFGIMTLAHLWATLGNTYCVLCLPVYTAFYQSLGILLLALMIKYWRKKTSLGNQVLILIFIILVCTGIGFNLVEQFSIAPINFVKNVLILHQNEQLSPDSLIENIFYPVISIFSFQNEADAIRFAKRVAGSFYGFATSILFLACAWLVYLLFRIKRDDVSFGYFAFSLFFLVSFILVPTKLLSKGYYFECKENEILRFEMIGNELAAKIPKGSQVYWMGYSPVLLLYLPDISIYYPQLNIYNNYVSDINSDQLYREGLWNRELSEIWASEATHIIITQKSFEHESWLVEYYIKSNIYQEIVLDTSYSHSCDNSEKIKIQLFERRE